MPSPIIYWEPSNICGEIQSELNRRKTNRSFNYVKNNSANWDVNTGDWNTYKGPMTSWVRVCSNGEGRVDEKGNAIKPRFVLNGGKGFYETYGFSSITPNGSNEQIIGYTPDKVPHVIQNSLVTTGANHQINVANPEISRIEVVVQQELFRRATIEWVCFSPAQLEYMTPYFLIPGLTVMVEWGWNHFNPTSLVPLHDINFMQEVWANSYPLYTENILRSKGNYDVMYGIISNFNWSIEGNKIVCSTEITSKDRLYAGIVKDSALTVKSNDDKPDGVFQSIKDFLFADDTVQNMKTIAESSLPYVEIKNISEKNKNNTIWASIYNPLIANVDSGVFAMKNPYVHGVFSGRSKKQYDSNLGKPDNADFDYSNLGNDKIWVNMGLVVEILNYFSALPGGKDKPMFSVDIMNSVISGHPNLISCNQNVLIPNSIAPKFHYGTVGLDNFAKARTDEKISETTKDENEYETQIRNVIGIPVGGSLADRRLSRLFYQGKNVCYRNDLDKIINKNRIDNAGIKRVSSLQNSSDKILFTWAFPSKESSNGKKLPSNPKGLPGNFIEKNVSGLLSNVYLNFESLKSAVQSSATYKDIYKNILQVLMDATDGFWDLELVEAENNMTIVDRRYIGSDALAKQGDTVFEFEYSAADSLIKGLKFRPQLSDAQATRTIFGTTNNKQSKYTTSDKNDMLDYKFRDAVIYNRKEREQGDSGELSKRTNESSQLQIRNLVSKVQRINVNGDIALQFSIPTFKTVSITTPSTSGPVLNTRQQQKIDKREYFKLILPDQQLLRMLLDDKDEDNNPRYCAVQPGIVLELTVQGIGGIRTFQYFLVKNLPEPYSEKNIIFRVVDVHQTLESGNWDTVIRAQPLPLRKYIKNRLRGPWSSQSPS